MEENKYLSFDGLAFYDDLIKKFIKSRIFIGSYEEYKAAYDNGLIPVGALVIITDGDMLNPDMTSPILGSGSLGYIVLA